MDKFEFFTLSTEQKDAIRAHLKEFDDARRGWMLKQWSKVSDSPQKAGYTALVLCATSFAIGFWLG